MSKPNILFVAPYRQSCGWGKGSQDFARALSTISNLTIRNIVLANNRETNLDKELIELENTKYSNYDILIQRVLPNFYHYDGRFAQNIGMGVFETELDNHNWLYRMNLMDKILIASKMEKEWLNKKIKSPAFNIGEPINTSLSNKDYPVINDVLNNDNIFKFLFIGENIQRKGISILLQAYLSAFSINDNVLLIIKTNQNISEEINNTKKIMRRFAQETKYPPIMMISERLSDDQINGLHQHSDVFVMPSFGEAFNRPAATSLIFGKPVIVTDNTSMADYVTDEYSWLINSTEEQVFCHQPPVPELYTSNEKYYIPNVLHLKKCMIEATTDWMYKIKSDNIIKLKVAHKFNYQTIGNNILKAINE